MKKRLLHDQICQRLKINRIEKEVNQLNVSLKLYDRQTKDT